MSRASQISFNWVLITISASSAPFSPWERSVRVVRAVNGAGFPGFHSIPKAGVEKQPGMLTFWISHVKLLEYLNIHGDRGMGMFLLLSDQVSGWRGPYQSPENQ